MSGGTSEKYEKVHSKIEKTISPYIMVKIPMPKGVDKEAFMKLENDTEFVESIKNLITKRLRHEPIH
jgi:hypothetical protein